MSGGSFDYAYFQVEQFCDLLEKKLREQGTFNKYGDQYPIFNKEVNNKLQIILKETRKTSELMKEVEWLFSDDTGEESFLENVKEIENNFNNT